MSAALPLPAPSAGPAPTSPATADCGPKILFASPEHDFGKAMAGEIVKHDFIFTNAGDAVLELASVRPSCGCTTATNWPRTVEPGRSGVIPVQFTSANFNGPVEKTVTVASNDKTQPSVVLHLKGKVWKPIEFNPQLAVLNVTAESVSNTTSVVRVINNADQAIAILGVECTNTAFAAVLKTNQPGKEFALIIRTVPPMPAQNVHGQVLLKTTASEAPVATVPVMVVPQPLVALIPPQIVLPSSALASDCTIPVVVRNNAAAPLALSEPWVSAGPGPQERPLAQAGAEAKKPSILIQTVDPGRQFTVVVTFPAGYEVGPHQNVELCVKSNHPQFPVLRVPVISRTYGVSPAMTPTTLQSAQGRAPVPMRRPVAR